MFFSASLLNFQIYLPSLLFTGSTSNTFTWLRYRKTLHVEKNQASKKTLRTLLNEQIQVHPREFSLEGFPFYFSVAIYCFEGAGMILSLEESLATEVSLLV